MIQNMVSFAERSYLLAAGTTMKIDRQASFLTCLESSDSFKIKLNNSPESDFGAGLQFEPIGGFSSVELRNPGATDITLTLGFGIGNMHDNRVTLNTGQTLPVRQSVPDIFSASNIYTIANADKIIVPANPLTRRVMVQNWDTSATVFLNGVTMTVNGNGLRLPPGGSAVEIETTDDVHAYCVATILLQVSVFAWSA